MLDVNADTSETYKRFPKILLFLSENYLIFCPTHEYVVIGILI